MKLRGLCVSIVVAFSLIVIDASLAYAQAISGPVVNPANGHVYYLLQSANWTTSQNIALSLGGNLVTINNAAEQDWVYTTFNNFGGVQRSLWTGFNDLGSAGTFTWVSGEMSPYTHWASGEPNNIGVERFAAMWSRQYSNASFWNNFTDISSYTRDGTTVPIHGVVEIVVVPDASTLVLMVPSLGIVSAGILLRRRKQIQFRRVKKS